MDKTIINVRVKTIKRNPGQIGFEWHSYKTPPQQHPGLDEDETFSETVLLRTGDNFNNYSYRLGTFYFPDEDYPSAEYTNVWHIDGDFYEPDRKTLVWSYFQYIDK